MQKSKRKPKAEPIRPPETEARPPDWATKTPDECSYTIVMYDSGGGEEQAVWLERAEFIALKEHLAKLRGVAVEGVDYTAAA